MQIKNNCKSYSKATVAGLLVVVCFFLKPASNFAQPVLSAENIALGGGGTAYLSGFEATFLNPANLAVPSHEGNLHIGLAHIGMSYEPILSAVSVNKQFSQFKSSFYPFHPGSNKISEVQRSLLLSENYSGNNTKSQHLNRADIILGGFVWQKNDKAFSVGVRTRLGSRVETGRGWYSPEFQDADDERIRDFTLNQQKQQLYEFSFGYAREFTLINGLIPRLSKLYIGIAPKLVISGMYHNLGYDARYSVTDNGGIIFNSDFSFKSTGDFSKATTRYMESADIQYAISGSLNRNIPSRPRGYGFGLDFGFTYLIPLGSELPTEKNNLEHADVTKSLRISFSFTDIGAIRYTKDPLQLSADQDSLLLDQQEISQSMFTGAGGQYLAFFDEARSLPNPLLNTNYLSRSDFSQVLPTSVNAGLLFELNRLKLISDLTLGINNTAFTTTKLSVHLGMEVRPHQQIPIRFGTRMASGTPVTFGFGTGFESRHWDLKLGTQIIMRSQTLTSEFAGGAFAGLQLHF